ncbi:hypothetical protein WEI85_11725 [Actinomycetes bacterium KLBMP 9797]
MRRPAAILVGLVVGFFAARLVIVLTGTVFTSFDTFSYAYRDDPAFDRGALVSFTGHAPRLWGVPLFYALFPGDLSRAVGQWAVGTVAWALLAWALWTCLRHPIARTVAAAGVLLLGLLPQVTNWDFAILSESLSISLGVATLALALLWGRTGSPWLVAGTVVAGVWWTFTRPDARVYTLLMVAALAVVAWRRPRLRRGALVGAAALAVAVGWGTAIAPAVDETYARYSATPQVRHEEGLMVFRLRLHVFPDPEVKALFEREFGMPSCPAMEQIAAGSSWQTAKFAEAYAGCPAMKAWGERNAGDVWRRYALTAPGTFARQTEGVLTLSLAGADYAKTTPIVPAPARTLVFPPRDWVLPVLGVALLLAAGALIVSRALRRRAGLVFAGAALTAASAASLAAGIWYGAGEYWRFGIQEAIGLRLAVLVMLVTALDAALTRQERQPLADQGLAQELGRLP